MNRNKLLEKFLRGKRKYSNTENMIGKDYNKEQEYKIFLKVLEQKAKTAICINKVDENMKFVGEYVERYPKIHLVKVYEDSEKKLYRVDIKEGWESYKNIR
ncbi:hypothetical protein FDA48_06010 [Clostridium botulinum]|nr:hypothetical protein [Clostridium botulinum]